MNFFQKGRLINDCVKDYDPKKGIIADFGCNFWRLEKVSGDTINIVEQVISDEVKFFYNDDEFSDIEDYELLEGIVTGVNGGIWDVKLREEGTLCYDIIVNKQIVVLANSYKPGGTCIAGREVSFTGDQLNFGNWIRPVSSQGGISPSDSCLNGGNQPQLLDIVEIPVIKHQPVTGQPENYLIDSETSWKKIGAIHPQQLAYLVESPSNLWGRGSYAASSSIRQNAPSQSLYLIKPEYLSLILYWHYGKKIKAEFRYNGSPYALQVTDPLIHNRYTSGIILEKDEEKQISLPNGNDYCLCISLAAEWRNKHYKLVAAII